MSNPSETNLALWRLIEKTDPAHTTKIAGKPYKGTSPKPHWLVLKATETFGPCGIGWGFTIIDDRVEEGAPGDRLHIARVRVWYEWNGKRGEVEHIGGTKIVGKDKNGPFSDEDAAKKSVTDALTKALSMIGFAGDIFLGRWDDSKYQAELREESRRIAPVQPGSTTITSGHRELISQIRGLLKELGRDEASLLTWAQAEAIEDIPSDRLREIQATLENAKRNRSAA